MIWLSIIALGILGILGRASVSLLAPATVLPWLILAVNAVGSFVGGWVYQSSNLSQEWKTALTVGLLGAFTTFSGFAIDFVKWAQAGQWGLAVSYLLMTNFACLAACFLGNWFGQKF